MDRFYLKTDSATKPDFIFKYDGGRISVLTDCAVRWETGAVTDLPSQRIWYRNISEPGFELERTTDKVRIKTSRALFEFDLKRNRAAVTPNGFKCVTSFSHSALPGTRRTLDMTDGRVRLDAGLVSRKGASMLDDSDSLLLEGSDFVERKDCGFDRYYFAYGNRYRECITDFFKLSGGVPLIPRFAFGNWWSRYHAYSADEYLNLMRRFEKEGIPFTVATVDMDWHWVDVKKRFGADAVKASADSAIAFRMGKMSSPGWTGYSPNTELFPDFKAFLKELNAMNLSVTMNLHPAQGIRPFEDCYDEFARYMGRDPSKKETIGFSLKNRKFIEAYFDVALRPFEKNGVRFWWIDWQQGKKSDVPGLDPLWALNHMHIADMASTGKRPLILSRYAGIGSHRYPLGFSGDAAMTFATLNFQPYLTACATNAAYTWWSHDIGGHHMGYKDDELYLRWLQFGVFSPIMRLHSTSDEFMGKEPWKYSDSVKESAVKYLQLRHKLIPYIYSLNYRTYKYGRALIEPMYYTYDENEAYKAENQYYFGDKLVVKPITRRVSRKTLLAETSLWVPEDRYTDIFTERIYGKGKYRIYRDLVDIPVFALPGAIIPVYRDVSDNSVSADKPLDIWIYRGNGSFDLYLDDGDGLGYLNGEYGIVKIVTEESGDKLTVSLGYEGDNKFVSRGLNLRLVFKDAFGGVLSSSPGKSSVGNTFVYTGEDVKYTLKGYEVLKNKPRRELIIDTVSKYQINNMRRRARYTPLVRGGKFVRAGLCRCFTGPIDEIFGITESENK